MKKHNDKPDKVVFAYNTATYLLRFRSELISELQKRGFECHAALPNNVSPEEGRRLTDLGVDIHFLKHFVDQRITPISDAALTFEYYRLYARLRPKVVFNFTAKPCIYSAIAARLAGVPVIAAMITGLGYLFMGGGLRGRLISLTAGVACRLALHKKAIVFFQNTDDFSFFLRRKIVTNTQGVLINGSGVNLELFTPKQNRDGGTVFLMVARLLKDKGVIEYLEACRIARERLPGARFLLVGPFDRNPSGLDPRVLQEYIRDGVVEYQGYLPDPLVAYNTATVFVLPSYHEGRPRTVLEAMACGLAVITSDSRGCRETIEHGVNGYLVPPRSYDVLSQRMIELGNNPARVQEMGAESRKIAEERYDVRHVTSAICETLCEYRRH